MHKLKISTLSFFYSVSGLPLLDGPTISAPRVWTLVIKTDEKLEMTTSPFFFTVAVVYN